MTMPDNNPNAPPEVRDQRTAPAGVLPKNTQKLVLIGLAAIMMLVIAFSGRNAPKEKAVPPRVGMPPIDPNAAQIQEYENQLKVEAKRLEVAKEQLSRTQASLDVASGPNPSAPYSPAAAPRMAVAESSAENLSFSDARKREAQSLFASNIVLSYRTAAAAPSAPAPPSPADLVAKALAAYAPGAAGLPEKPSGPEAGLAARNRQELDAQSAQTRAAERDAAIDRADGNEYRLFEGTLLETVLTNRLEGSFSGPVDCMVTADVYSHNGQHVLIPQGSRVLGEVRKVETFGDTKLAVVFHRLIMPDGYSVSLDKFQGLNQIGETGLQDQINHHYLQVFGVSIALGLVAGFSQANTTYGIGESATDAYRQGMASSLSQSSTHILDRYLNVLPTITIREGHRVKIYLSDDLLLPAFDHHQMEDNL
jgi:type IV secretion system protein VirB10